AEPEGEIESVRFSPDSTTLTCQSHTFATAVRTLDNPTTQFLPGGRGLAGLSFSDRAGLLVYRDDARALRLRDVAARKDRAVLSDTARGGQPAFSPDGKWVAVYVPAPGTTPAGGQVRVFTTLDGKVRYGLPHPTAARITFCADSQSLLSNGW